MEIWEHDKASWPMNLKIRHETNNCKPIDETARFDAETVSEESLPSNVECQSQGVWQMAHGHTTSATCGSPTH